MEPIIIAEMTHEVNRAWCKVNGDLSQPSWDEAPDWQKVSALNGVKFRLNNPDSTPEDSHNNWLQEKIEQGWKYGEIKDVDKKEHSCFRPYSELPYQQRIKDSLFQGIIDILK